MNLPNGSSSSASVDSALLPENRPSPIPANEYSAVIVPPMIMLAHKKVSVVRSSSDAPSAITHISTAQAISDITESGSDHEMNSRSASYPAPISDAAASGIALALACIRRAVRNSATKSMLKFISSRMSI